MAAKKFKLDTLVAVVDQNGYQQTGPTAEVMDMRPLAPKWEAFGWYAQEIDGHDLAAVIDAYGRSRNMKGKPSVIIGRTQKGHPIQPLLTKDPNHHGKPLTADEAKQALEYIDTH